MNTETGEIRDTRRIESFATGTRVKPVSVQNLSAKTRADLERTGRAYVTRNSRYPCGSGKRFKRCCYQPAVGLPA